MLKSLFNPESVAVIGASRTPGKVGHEIAGTGTIASADRTYAAAFRHAGVIHVEGRVRSVNIDFI